MTRATFDSVFVYLRHSKGKTQNYFFLTEEHFVSNYIGPHTLPHSSAPKFQKCKIFQSPNPKAISASDVYKEEIFSQNGDMLQLFQYFISNYEREQEQILELS